MSSSKGSGSDAASNDSVTSVADPSFVKERPIEIERGSVLAGRYQIEGVIGKGGSGVVLRGYDRTAQAAIAIKLLKPELAHDAQWSKRFSRELRLGRPIRHPNVCRIFDIGEAEGHRFLTMELASGGTLRDLIKRAEPLRPLPERLADAGCVVAGLAAIHGAGIVHRDVKPDNMLRMEDGRLALSDFGLATDLPTAVSVLVGTPHYMAPEVRAGEPATTRSDVWSLGVALHEIFFGKRPERRPGSSSGTSKTNAAPTWTSTERAMAALCDMCLADNPEQRPADARAVESLFAQARRRPRSFGRAPSRRRLAALGILAAAVVAGVFAIPRGWRRPSPGSSAVRSAIVRLEPTGTPVDWTSKAKVIAAIPGPVHCFSIVDSNTARIVWGDPRRAEDVDLDSGVRRPSHLISQAYAVGCPDLSPNHRSLLFTAHTAAGLAEIRESTQPDGRGAVSVTAGVEPLWLKDDEFIYSVDAAHAAVFSLSTMSFALLSDPGFGGQQAIADKAVSPAGTAIGLLFAARPNEWAVSVYEGAAFDQRTTFVVGAGDHISFDKDNRLFVSYELSGALSTFAQLDWRHGVFRHVGQYLEYDLVGMRPSREGDLLLARHRAGDAWLTDGPKKLRLTNDGTVSSVAMSSGGEILLAKKDRDGNEKLWSRSPDGVEHQVTDGPFDLLPDFSPDGQQWTYVDYIKKTIMICSQPNKCQPLVQNNLLPAWPRFSPDGRSLAYITEFSGSRLMVMSLANGTTVDIGSVYGQCPPVWSSATRLWSLERATDRYAWTERNVLTTQRTGRKLELDAAIGSPNEVNCWPTDDQIREIPSFRRRVSVLTEETSRILRQPGIAR